MGASLGGAGSTAAAEATAREGSARAAPAPPMHTAAATQPAAQLSSTRFRLEAPGMIEGTLPLALRPLRRWAKWTRSRQGSVLKHFRCSAAQSANRASGFAPRSYSKTNSTRRFWVRPSSVSLLDDRTAIGITRHVQELGSNLLGQEVAQHHRGACSRQLPVGRKERALDRAIVGVPLDRELTPEVAGQLTHRSQHRQPALLQLRGSGIKQDLVASAQARCRVRSALLRPGRGGRVPPEIGSGAPPPPAPARCRSRVGRGAGRERRALAHRCSVRVAETVWAPSACRTEPSAESTSAVRRLRPPRSARRAPNAHALRRQRSCSRSGYTVAPHIGYVSHGGLYKTFYEDTVPNIRKWLDTH